jgi:hypothetical protein
MRRHTFSILETYGTDTIPATISRTCHRACAHRSWRPRLAALWGSRSRSYPRRYTIPNLAYLTNIDIHRATRSDAKSDVRRGKAPPLAGSHPSDAARSNACAPVQAFAASIASKRLSRTKRARKATDPARASCPGTGRAPRRRLFRVAAIHVAELGKASLPCPEVDQFAAGSIELVAQGADDSNAATGCVLFTPVLDVPLGLKHSGLKARVRPVHGALEAPQFFPRLLQTGGIARRWPCSTPQWRYWWGRYLADAGVAERLRGAVDENAAVTNLAAQVLQTKR